MKYQYCEYYFLHSDPCTNYCYIYGPNFETSDLGDEKFNEEVKVNTHDYDEYPYGCDVCHECHRTKIKLCKYCGDGLNKTIQFCWRGWRQIGRFQGVIYVARQRINLAVVNFSVYDITTNG